MEVVVTTGVMTHKSLSNCHHQQTNIPFFTGHMPFLSLNQQHQSIEGKEFVHVGGVISQDSRSEEDVDRR